MLKLDFCRISAFVVAASWDISKMKGCLAGVTVGDEQIFWMRLTISSLWKESSWAMINGVGRNSNNWFDVCLVMDFEIVDLPMMFWFRVCASSKRV